MLNVAIVVTSGYSLLEVAMITEALRIARDSQQPCSATVEIFRISNQETASKGGAQLAGLKEIDTLEASLASSHDHVFLCTGPFLQPDETDKLMRLIRRLIRNRSRVCVTGAAISLFVKSGYVDRATDHWTRLASLSENCKLQSISDSMFVTDGRVTTCAGEFAIMDYLADWLSQSLSARHAKRAAERLIAYAPRLAFEKQPHSATLLIKGLPPPLRKAVEIMVNAIETPASIRSIADTSGLSARQLERLFKRYLDCSPSAFYKRIRLERSLSLIMQTELSLTEIAIACGFASQSNFSRNFSRLFGVKPTVVRAKSPSELNIEPNQVPYMAGV